MHLNSVEARKKSSSTKKLMLMSSNLASPAYVMPAAVEFE
jgi:hypothetical protein